MSEAIMSREEQFDSLMKVDMNSTELGIANESFHYLIKPIVEEMKRFYKGYMVSMARNNMTICEPVQLPRICTMVFAAVEEQLKQEMLK